MSLPQLDGPRLAPINGIARQLVVLLHGYGSDGNDLISLGKVWQMRFPDAAFVAPNAPQPAPSGPGYQWFALERIDPQEYVNGATAARTGLEAFLDAELKAQKVAPENLVLMGFSQGAMMVLHAGLQRAVPLIGARRGPSSCGKDIRPRAF